MGLNLKFLSISNGTISTAVKKNLFLSLFGFHFLQHGPELTCWGPGNLLWLNYILVFFNPFFWYTPWHCTIWGWEEFKAESHSEFSPFGIESQSGLSPFRVESQLGLSSVRVESSQGWVHSGLGPFWVQSILSSVHSEFGLFWAQSTLTSVHSQFSPFGAQSIRGSVHLRFSPFRVESF